MYVSGILVFKYLNKTFLHRDDVMYFCLELANAQYIDKYYMLIFIQATATREI